LQPRNLQDSAPGARYLGLYADKLIGKMTTFYPFCMTSWEAILTKEVIVPSPTMSANVINKDNEGAKS
jgi:hypothetical protein